MLEAVAPLSELDASIGTINRRDQGRSGGFRHAQIEAEFSEHLPDSWGVGMLGAEACERRTRRGGLGRMPRLAPVDEERDDAVAQHRRGTRESPGEKNAIRALPAPGTDRSEIHAAPSGLGRKALEVLTLRRPRGEARSLQAVDAEAPRAPVIGLIGIGADDLEIRRRPQRDQRVSGSRAGMLASRRRPNSEEPLDRVD